MRSSVDIWLFWNELLERESAVINENQDDWAHFVTDFIIFHFKSLDFKSDSDVKEAESEWLAERSVINFIKTSDFLLKKRL